MLCPLTVSTHDSCPWDSLLWHNKPYSVLGTSDHKKINGNRPWDDKLLNQSWDYLFVSDRVPKNEWQ